MKTVFFVICFTFFVTVGHAETKQIFYPNGKLFQDIDFTASGKDWKIFDANGVLTERKKFDSAGNLVDEKFYDAAGNLIQNGSWKGFNMFGKLSRSLTLKDGKIEGDDLHYDEQGKVNWRRVYKNGELVSEQTFDKDGNLKYSKGAN